MPKKIWVVEWDEYEEGWGSRPNGYSLHTSKEICDSYMQKRIMNSSEYYSDDPTKPYQVAISKPLDDTIKANGCTLLTDKVIW